MRSIIKCGFNLSIKRSIRAFVLFLKFFLSFVYISIQIGIESLTKHMTLFKKDTQSLPETGTYFLLNLNQATVPDSHVKWFNVMW